MCDISLNMINTFAGCYEEILKLIPRYQYKVYYYPKQRDMRLI